MALIPNSGSGRRFGALTARRPKCLLEVAGRSILARQLELLAERGLDRFLITTGPFASEVERAARRTLPAARFEFVHNERFESTNYIYSLWLTRERLGGPVLLLHGDLVFVREAIDALLSARGDARVLVNDAVEPPAQDFKARLIHEHGAPARVAEIGVDLDGDDCHFLAPCYALSAERMGRWMSEISRFVAAGKTSAYAEDALNPILTSFDLRAIPFHGFCTEVDTPDDLSAAEIRLRALGGT